MENLEILHSSISTTAKKIISGHTVEFYWQNELNADPNMVSFVVKRHEVGNPDFTGNQIITGAYFSDMKKFDVQNNNFVEGDLELYQEILAVCEEITEPKTE